MMKKLRFSRKEKPAPKPVGIMGRVVNRVRKKAGTAPGTLMHTGERKTEKVITRYLDYDENELNEGEIASAEDCFPFARTPSITWIDIAGLHDMAQIEAIGKALELHPLMLEDIVSPTERPKLEDYDASLFIVLKILSFDRTSKRVEIDQMSLVVGKTYVLSFQEKPWDVLDPIRTRIRLAKGRIRHKGSDYLAYAIIDAVVDGYFKILEEIGDEIEELEELVVTDPSAEVMHRIHAMKREVLVLRKAVWPLREVLGSLYRNESELIESQTQVFLRDVYDHAVQIIDIIETFRDLLSGTNDLYISTVSNRMNEVMKVLTIIATIFIPLSFFAAVYGMNFDYMPELKVRWAYPAFLVAMGLITLGMLWYFRRKRWL
ncbi:MAG: magnesium/cobalt transporter CorA [Opitutaceae bacterium]